MKMQKAAVGHSHAGFARKAT